MARISRTLTAHCSIRDLDGQYSFTKAEVLRGLKTELIARLEKKGVTLEWLDPNQTPELAIRFVGIHESDSSLLRQLMPLLSPTTIALSWQITLDSRKPLTFERKRHGYYSLMYGVGGMFRNCYIQLAKDITKQVVKAIKAAPKGEKL